MSVEDGKRVLLAARPVGEPKESDFRIEQTPVPKPGAGEMLLRTLWLSLDPYMRGRMSDAPSYAKPVEIGQVMEGRTVSEVVASNRDGFAAGDIVLSPHGWQTHAVSDGKGLRKIDPALAPVSTALGVLGMPGMTAYTGLLDIGHPQPGETVVVSAASGAVGSVVGQIAKTQGRTRGRHRRRAGQVPLRDRTARLRGLHRPSRRRPAGAAQGGVPEGHRRLFRECRRRGVRGGVSAARTISRACRCAARLRPTTPPRCRPVRSRTSTLTRAILTKRLTLRGFIVSDFAARQGDFLRDVSAWLREGRIKYREDVVDGLEKAPRALIGLLRGENFGKMLVRVAAERRLMARRDHDPFAHVREATLKHRARHGCGAYPYSNGPLLSALAALAGAKRILELGCALATPRSRSRMARPRRRSTPSSATPSTSGWPASRFPKRASTSASPSTRAISPR